MTPTAAGRGYLQFEDLARAESRVSRTVTNWQDGIFNANEPNADIETLYEYDANGNTLIVTDTVGRMTRTFYDALNRVEGTITNWDGSTALSDCDGLPAIRDTNICTQYEYDALGNQTAIRCARPMNMTTSTGWCA